MGGLDAFWLISPPGHRDAEGLMFCLGYFLYFIL